MVGGPKEKDFNQSQDQQKELSKEFIQLLFCKKKKKTKNHIILYSVIMKSEPVDNSLNTDREKLLGTHLLIE